MRVRCIANLGSELPADCLDESAGIRSSTEFPLTIDAIYVVYAITVFHSHTWYYVFDDNRLSYPVWKLAPLFEIESPSIPPDWIIGYVRRSRGDSGFPLISFPEWAENHFFYERLVDGDPAANEVFTIHRAAAEA